MLAIIAVIIFAIAFIIRVTATATDAVFAPASLVILGLICVALHLAGLGRLARAPVTPSGAGTAAGLRLPAAVPLYRHLPSLDVCPTTSLTWPTASGVVRSPAASTTRLATSAG